MFFLERNGVKMSDDTSTVKLVPDCIDKPVKSMLNPLAKEIGSTLSDLLFVVTGQLHFKVAKQQAQYDHDLEVFRKELDEKVGSKPAEVLREPELQVVGHALDAAKYCLQETQISEMFQNLIANAADTRYQKDVHPSFAAIISQLSPLDAENLALFLDSEQHPIVEYRLVNLDESYKVFFADYFIANPNMTSIDDMVLQAASLGSLVRQGLLEISYTTYITAPDAYLPFYKTGTFSSMESLIIPPPPGGFRRPDDDSTVVKADFEKGLVRLTPLGKSFLKVCFSV